MLPISYCGICRGRLAKYFQLSVRKTLVSLYVRRRLGLSEKQQADQVSINIFDLIDSICAEFRQQWKAGKRPPIEDYLLKVPENAREQLFRNILLVDKRYRERAGEHPSPGDYVDRFSSYRRVIGDAFNFSTSVSMDALQGTPDSDSGAFAATVDMPAANRIGDYELVRELGRGGFGVVYEAKHTKTGNRVALKTLPTGQDGQEVNADRLYRFRNEFRRLSEINHPNLVGMQTLEVDGSQWFFTMDLIEGEDFLRYVRPGEQFDEAKLRTCLSQLASGVMELHRRGIIHRDLKPSNVLVTADGRVTILDFGLAAELQKATDMTQTRSGMFAGTPRYAAPEQMFGERTEASDWYAFGTMLYEALVGEAPFHGKDQVALLRQKQEQDPPQLSIRNELPSDLAELADRLVRRKPDERLTADAVGDRLGLNQDTLISGSTKQSHGSTGSVDEEESTFDDQEDDEIVLFGREKQLAQLEAAKGELLDRRQPVVVFITGLSGEGKSSLAEKFLRPIRQGSDMLVLSGRCYDRESVPFKAVDSIIDPLVAYLRSSRSKWLEPELPNDIPFLAQLFPLLGRVESIKRKSATVDIGRMEPEKIRARGFYALRNLLVTISQRTPVVILIDDLQWADADSAQAWADLLTGDDPPAVLFLGSYRSDEADESSYLQTWYRLTEHGSRRIKSHQVQVKPLSSEHCIELAAIRTGADRNLIQKRANELFADTGGNPYLLEQLTEGFDAATGSFRHVPLDELVAERLAKLPANAVDLLNTIAISGQPIAIHEASHVIGSTTSDLATLTHMRSERLVRLIGDRNQSFVDTYHDKIRETVLAGMSDSTRQQWHLKLAETIEANENLRANELLQNVSASSTPGEFAENVSPRVFDLAHHFDMADDQRAFVYQLLAGEQSLNAYAIEDAVGFYEQAAHLLPTESNGNLRFRLSIAMGRVSLWNKNLDAALDGYQSAVDAAECSPDRARAYMGLAEAHEQVARFDDAVKFFDCALECLGVRRNRTLVGKLLSMTTNALTVLTIPGKSSQRNQDANVNALKLSILRGLMHILAEKDMASAAASGFQAPLAAFRAGDTQLGYAMASEVFSALGMNWAGNLCLQRMERQQNQSADPINRARTASYRAQGYFWGGKPAEAEVYFEKAIPLLRRCGDFYELQRASHMLRHARACVGDSSSELKAAQDLLELAAETGNVQGICWGNYDVASAFARQGNLADALRYIQQSYAVLRGERHNMTEAIRASTDAYVRLQASSYRSARRRSEVGWETAISTWVLIDVSLLCLPIAIESDLGPEWTAPATPAKRKGLRKLLQRATLLYQTVPNHRAHLLRVAGRAHWAMGKSRKAIRKIDKAIHLSRQKKMGYQRAKSLLDLAAVQEANRDENRDDAVRLLKEMESVIPRAESWLLGDRYDEAVVAPEFDLDAWERQHGPICEQEVGR